jgi:alcohol dehydrogenase
MKALVFHGKGRKKWEEKPKPVLEEGGDAIVRITRTTICGTDLHILRGDVPTVTPGRTLGHEATGIVEQVGDGVASFKTGDRVLLSCITACGRCESCRGGMYSHCSRGGWVLGNTIDGTQAEYVRVPQADLSLHPVPKGADEEALVMCSDVLPTSFECGILNGRVQPGDSVAIVGAGPIGLAALLTGQLFSPAMSILLDVDPNRLEVAKKFGATHVVDSRDRAAAVKQVMDLTGGRGVQVSIEAVGVPEPFDLCQSVVAAGGRLASIGVFGKPVELRMERLWSHNLTLTTRLVDTITTPQLLKMVANGRLQPGRLITHRFALDEIEQAYATFDDAARQRALKVVLAAG